jgi:hypothetical protein
MPVSAQYGKEYISARFDRHAAEIRLQHVIQLASTDTGKKFPDIFDQFENNFFLKLFLRMAVPELIKPLT